MITTTCITFVGDQCGKAQEAIELYVSIFPDSTIKTIKKYQEGEPGGSPDLIKFAVFTLNGVDYMVSESNYDHRWSFTPAVSICVMDSSEALIKRLFDALSSDGGQILVPLDNYDGEGDYGFGKLFGWCEDRYGISWQFIVTE